MNLKDLQQEVSYKWRPQYRKNKETGKSEKIGDVAYIDARDVQDLLDKVVGPEGWQSDFKLIDGKLFGGIGIEIAPDKWVWKWDCGTESEFEEEKGQVSDAFKRAGVQWGIGRFLYDLKPTTKPHSFVEEAKDHIDFTATTSRNENAKINEVHDYCTICAGHVSSAEKKYCIEKKLPIMCYECQKGKSIVSKSDLGQKRVKAATS